MINLLKKDKLKEIDELMYKESLEDSNKRSFLFTYKDSEDKKRTKTIKAKYITSAVIEFVHQYPDVKIIKIKEKK